MPQPTPPLPLPFLKGQQIAAGPLEVLRKAVEWLFSKRVVSVQAPLMMRETPGGTILSFSLQDRGIGITTSTISARGSSSLTLGSGTVQPYMDGSSLTSNGPAITVKNFTGGSIASGVLVVFLRIGASWYVIAADCSGVGT